MYKVLFVDDEAHVRSLLLDYFEGKYAVYVACDAQEALNIMEQTEFHLVVSDISMPGMNGINFLREVNRLYPQTKRALLTSLNIDDYIAAARQDSISSMIPKTVPFNFEEVELIINGLLTGEIFGVSHYLNRGERVIMGQYCVMSSDDVTAVRDSVVNELTEKFDTVRDTGLILDEILTNAVYHASAKQAQGESKFAQVVLAPSEYVYVRVGHDSEKYAVSVLDTQGRLTRDTVLDKLVRHISGDGLLDDSGRGLYMSRLFTDRMVINIEPDKRTEIIIMNYLSPKYRGYKPLYINEI